MSQKKSTSSSTTIVNSNNSNDPVIQWVTYYLDNEVYGVNVMQVREVLRVSEIAPVPGSPEYVLGIINLRGNVVTVIDTRKRFGLDSKKPDDLSRVIVAEVNDSIIGMLVDSVAEVVYLRQSEIEPSPSVSSDDNAYYIQGVCSRGEELIILVDITKILEKFELDNLKN